LPNNVSSIQSLNVVAELLYLSCRQHPGSTEDIFCLSCVQLLCAKCYINDHAQHQVTSVETASESFRCQLEQSVELAETLNAHLTRATVALKDFEDRTSTVERQILHEKRTKTKRIDDDTGVLLEQLAARLDPVRRKVNTKQKSVNEIIKQCRAISCSPRDLLRQFSAIKIELERLRHLIVDINVDEIEQQQVDFTQLSLADWIPLDSVNLIGRLTSPSLGDQSDLLTVTQLTAELDAAQKRESSLLTELQKTKEQQRVINDRFSEQLAQHKQQEARMAESNRQLCQYVEVLRARIAKVNHMLELETVKNTELERKMAAHDERLMEASRRTCEMETLEKDLKGQIDAGKLREQGLEEQLKIETRWRRAAESESRERRDQNEALIRLVEEERERAERRYSELQDNVASMLRNAKKQTRQAMWAATLSRETVIRRQTEDSAHPPDSPAVYSDSPCASCSV